MTARDSVLDPAVSLYAGAAVMPCLSCGTPRGSMEEEHCFLGGVYSDGQPVPEALLLRSVGTGGQLVYQAPYLEPTVEYAGAHIFCGLLAPHFGHFILEGLARIWFAGARPEQRLVWMLPPEYRAEAGYGGWQREILELLGIHNEAVFVRSPTRFEHLAIPSAGHVLPDFFAPYYFDALGVAEPSPVIPGRKVYVSRTRGSSGGGGYTNEAELEAFLRDAGWTIYHPQDHPVSARFDVLSSAEVILLIEGSAFLSLLFLRELHSKVFLLKRNDRSDAASEVAFAGIYGAAAVGKSIQVQRLDLPKRLVRGTHTLAWSVLNLDAFRELMDDTDFLSRDTELLRRRRVPVRHHVDDAIRRLLQARKRVSIQCTPEQALWYQSGLCAQAGDLEGAIRAMRALEAGGNPGACAHSRLAMLLAQQGDLAGAITAQKAAIDANPSENLQLVLGLAWLLRRAGDLNGAGATLDVALKLAAADFRVHLEQSRLRVEVGDLDAAIVAAETAVRLVGEDAELYLHLGHLLLKRGALVPARTALGKARALDPQLPGVYVQLSLLHAKTKQLGHAMEMIDAALRLRPDDSDLLRRRHRLLGQLRYGRVIEAVLHALDSGFRRLPHRLGERLSRVVSGRLRRGGVRPSLQGADDIRRY